MSARALLHPGGTALVVIDFQEKLVRALPEQPVWRAIRTVSRLLPLLEILNVPVLWTEQYPVGLGPTVSELAERLQGKPRFEKTTFSCFGAPGFGGWLWEHGIGRLVLSGIETHICVLQTALEALQAGLTVHVLANGVCCYHPEDQERALARIQQAGGVITSREIVAYELLGRADTPAFRAALPYLRERD